MANCKITLKPLKSDSENETGYSHAGLNSLFGTRSINPVMSHDRKSLIRGFVAAKNKMSISGAQPKRSAVIEDKNIELTDTGGRYILKPSPEEYEHLAEVEHASMLITKALASRLTVADCGLVQLSNGELVYITKRYDRSEAGKQGQEQIDASMGLHNKYDDNVSYERIGRYINAKVEVPLPALIAFFEQVVISYLIGNNDLHIRNLSLLVDEYGKVTGMTPAYDMVAASLYMDNEFMALPLTIEDEADNEGSTKGFRIEGFYTREDFIEFGSGVGLNPKVANDLISNILRKLGQARTLIKDSYIPEDLQERFQSLLVERESMLRDKRITG
jgi:serine/threonine-protein kinase HipA